MYRSSSMFLIKSSQKFVHKTEPFKCSFAITSKKNTKKQGLIKVLLKQALKIKVRYFKTSVTGCFYPVTKCKNNVCFVRFS